MTIFLALSLAWRQTSGIGLRRRPISRRVGHWLLATPKAPSAARSFTWVPQDLTKDIPGFEPIPDTDYVKQFERQPDLWPVEFFVVAYRRVRNQRTQKSETQLLVRKSANGTSKFGIGTGVPVTRWLLSTEKDPPFGYERSKPNLRFEASNFPEFPRNGEQSWAYDKIHLRADAFTEPPFHDPELEAFAAEIRDGLRLKFSEQLTRGEKIEAWEARRLSVVKAVLDKPNSRAAIQGALRMSGLFRRRRCSNQAPGTRPSLGSRARFIEAGGEAAPDLTSILEATRVFTMFPQMPDPLPPPSTSQEALREEMASREVRMAKSGRDPHQDRHGRMFTHKSTSNVSNTIHGVYLTLDCSAFDRAVLDEVPALDLFGTEEIEREWRSMEDLKVLDSHGDMGTEDTKPIFISGFVVRELFKSGSLAARACVL